jgi:hypothetical protein
VFSIPTWAAMISVALASSPPDTVTCTPTGYAQVQNDGVEYDKVNCIRSKRSKPECSARSYRVSDLQLGPLAYSLSKTLPLQEEFKGRSHLVIDRDTGTFTFVVIATQQNDPDWFNVKTFYGTCVDTTAVLSFR